MVVLAVCLRFVAASAASRPVSAASSASAAASDGSRPQEEEEQHRVSAGVRSVSWLPVINKARCAV